MNLDTLSSDSSEEEIRDSGSSFLFPDSWGSDLYFPYFGKYSSLPGGGGKLIYINMYAPFHIGRSMPTAATLVCPYLHHYHSGK